VAVTHPGHPVGVADQAAADGDKAEITALLADAQRSQQRHDVRGVLARGRVDFGHDLPAGPWLVFRS
jgi:hypothetical protein